MANKFNLTLIAAGALAIAALSLPAYAGAARGQSVATSEFSAEVKKDNKKFVGSKKVPKAGTVHVAPHVKPRVVTPRFTVKKNLGVQKKVGPKVVLPKTGTQHIVKPKIGLSKSTHKVFVPRGTNARVITSARIRSAPARGAFRTSIRGHNYSVWRNGYRVRHGNRWRTFVALSALGALAIGAAEYYPYAYIDAPEDDCDGLTEDGCQLVFDDVETMEGDVVGQCVAYCPWR
jgi:hypothetical protein